MSDHDPPAEDDWHVREQLHFAAGRGDIDEVRRLVAEGRDVNAFDDLGWSPLHHAVKEERLEVAAFLIASGADVNARHEPSIGDTPLAGVAGTCSPEMARLLLESGADPTIRGWMQLNALDRASRRKRFDGPVVYAMLLKAAGQEPPRRRRRR